MKVFTITKTDHEQKPAATSLYGTAYRSFDQAWERAVGYAQNYLAVYDAKPEGPFKLIRAANDEIRLIDCCVNIHASWRVDELNVE